MTDRPNIGQILMRSGRVSTEDVTRALDHQARHGGYFGEALVACGVVSEEEVEWGLASQFDLPYVFPDAEAVDYLAASLVTPEWALSHLTLPIMRTEESLKVLVDSPLRTESVEELRSRTALDVELALASPSQIRELIRAVYARGTAAEEEAPGQPVELSQAFDKAREAAAPRFGVSVRGTRAWAWWDDGGVIRRRPLAGAWQTELESLLEPGLNAVTEGQSPGHWDAHLAGLGEPTSVEVRYLSDESGSEILIQPTSKGGALHPPFSAPPAGIVSEVRLLARSGKARFVVTSDPVELGHEILPHLPSLLCDVGWRSVYVHARASRGESEVFSRRLPDDPALWAGELEALRAFHFDVVSVDLTGGADWASAALDLASVAFLLWSSEDLASAYAAGVRWHLHLAGEATELAWRLEPLAAQSTSQ